MPIPDLTEETRPPVLMSEISLNEFKRNDIRVGTITSVSRIKGSDSLYRLLVDLGDDKRQVVAGLVKYYTEAELQEKRVIFLANIKPATIFGFTSSGMILCSRKGSKVSLLTTDTEMPSGASIT